ncbi:MAG: non-hydrolyzing UDP-N-acetylglucosamine 2-epimerase, partial [Dictyoglomus sp.]
NVYVVGNTVIDALLFGLRKIQNNKNLKEKIESFFSAQIHYKQGDKIILVTGHRRESFGEGFENICKALKELALEYRDIKIVYPVHLNPNVKEPVYRILKDIENLYLLEPLDYPCFIWLLSKSYLVLTDSGGIQEEAPSLGKPVLVMREVTERIEGIQAGTAILIGTDAKKIVNSVKMLLEDSKKYKSMSKAVNPYGDGKASERVVDYLRKSLF